MPVASVTTHPLTDERRAEMARDLTDGIAEFAQVDPDKVLVFFDEQAPGPCTIEVKAVAAGPDESAWKAAIRDAIDHTYEIRIRLYEPQHTARGGVLRTPPTDPERP